MIEKKFKAFAKKFKESNPDMKMIYYAAWRDCFYSLLDATDSSVDKEATDNWFEECRYDVAVWEQKHDIRGDEI